MNPHVIKGPWVTQRRTFSSMDELVDEQRRLHEASPCQDQLTVTEILATDESDGETVIVAYLGNGPTAAKHARMIESLPRALAALEALVAEAPGYWPEAKEARAVLAQLRGEW